MLRTASKIGTGDQHPTPVEPESASEPQIRRLLATVWTATTSRRWTAFAWSNHWVRPAFGFNIQEVIDLFDSWGWVVNVFDGLEEDDK